MLARVHCFLEEDSQIVEFLYRQRVGWILTYRSIVPCLSALGWTWLRKDLDFNLVSAGSDPNSGCLGSVDWRSLSALLAVSLLILGSCDTSK